uniref:Metalloendopeptidase n=1 Tax=Acrobeloides nanus TaxID=290746 RepID=A0A914EAS4_9BILA
MLGVYHQQSRYDRDNFVYVDVSNILAGYEHSYAKYTSTNTNNYQVPYDYGSVMHYAEEGFTANPTQPVMIAYDPLYQNTMGQRTGPSFNDILLVNRHYGCLNQCPTSLVCQNGGFQNPANCTKCICPGGFWGSLCEQRDPGSNPGICGSTVQATCDWQTLNGSAGSNVAQVNTFPGSCWWHIQALQGQQIEIQFQNAGGYCSSGCFYGAVEAKMGKFENVGYRFCCPDDLPNSDLFTDSNLAIIGASSRYLTQRFILTYRIKNGCVTEKTTTFKTTTAIPISTTLPLATTTATPSTTTTTPTPTTTVTQTTAPTTTATVKPSTTAPTTTATQTTAPTTTTTVTLSTTTAPTTTVTQTTAPTTTTTVTPSTTAPTTTATQTIAPTTTTITPSTTTKKHRCKKCCRCQTSESSESSEECSHHRRHRHHRRHSCGCEEEEGSTTTASTTTKQASTTTTTVFTCDKASLDLVFVVDASASIGIYNFNKTLDALIATVANITIGPNDDQS